MSKKLPTTPRSRIKNALRQVWLRSRERAACLKAARHCCERCGVHASVAKGREQKIEVHHRRGICWDGIVDGVIAAMLPDPSQLEAVCPACHAKEHAPVRRDQHADTDPHETPAACQCGCQYFVYWVAEAGIYSTATPRDCYRKERHPQAVCSFCNRFLDGRAKGDLNEKDESRAGIPPFERDHDREGARP